MTCWTVPACSDQFQQQQRPRQVFLLMMLQEAESLGSKNSASSSFGAGMILIGSRLAAAELAAQRWALWRKCLGLCCPLRLKPSFYVSSDWMSSFLSAPSSASRIPAVSKPVTQQKVALVGPSSSYNLSPAPRATPLAQRLKTGVATLDVFGQVARDAKRDRSSVS